VATYTFTPPTVAVVPRFLPNSTTTQWLLYRHFGNLYRGVNVYWLSDGTFSQDYPTPENQNTQIPYPWNPSRPNDPIATWRNADGTLGSYSLPVWIRQVFWGGHSTVVDAGTAQALNDAGYHDYVVSS
jgi:hypothetical protein